MNTAVKLINDEPVTTDSLGRSQLLKGLISAVKHCETPFVMAINGGWGTGKTSILKCLEKEFKTKKSKALRTVWFSPWKFQFEDAPAVSLLQHIRDTAVREKWVTFDKSKREVLKLLNIVGSLLGEIALKTVTGHSVSTKDIMNQGKNFEKKYFEVKQLTARMQEELQKAIKSLVGNEGRLIFFIDDLDRCRTENALRLLEALKLYLNSQNCVYIIAIDMENLGQNLETECNVSNPLSYLEKIFQLVYTLPQPDYDKRTQLVVDLLKDSHPSLFSEKAPSWLKHNLAQFMGDNPRSLKHFCNRFLLESAVLQESLGDNYDPMSHIFLQILQHCFPAVYKLFQNNCCIIVNRNPAKDFDRFTAQWSSYFNNPLPGNPDAEYIEREPFKPYFDQMPCLNIKSPLEYPYKFVTVTSLESGNKGIVCIEKHPKNSKIQQEDNISEMDDLSGTVLRNLNLSHCLLDRCNFNKADLNNTRLSYSDCSGSKFLDTSFKCVEVKETIFDDADLSRLNSEGTYLSCARINNVNEAKLPESLKKSIMENTVDE